MGSCQLLQRSFFGKHTTTVQKTKAYNLTEARVDRIFMAYSRHHLKDLVTPRLNECILRKINEMLIREKKGHMESMMCSQKNAIQGKMLCVMMHIRKSTAEQLPF